MKTESLQKTYPEDAYTFVSEVVSYAIQKSGEMRHISALELLESCKLYAAEQYGFLAGKVLENWSIKCGDDIGNIVYELISNGKLSASPGDRREDFSVKFDLFETNTFRIKYKISIDKPLIDD